jgi:lipoprotein-anchoring transpeptidase ErfK/SrfK
LTDATTILPEKPLPFIASHRDKRHVGPLPDKVSAQSKLKFLPYRNAAEAIFEKFHADIRFLNQLNPGKMKTIKPGDQLMVPNVEPFELASVKAINLGSDVTSEVANDIEAQQTTQSENQNKSTTASVTVNIDTKTNMLEVHEGDKVIAAYPMTIGSAHTASPIGEWKVGRITKMPTFRYDKEMLQHGKRSGNFYLLRPGPRNPVGVMWIALNKKGIGIHGTDAPDSIGRAASHGCIRLANWDIVRLATKIKSGDVVSIH